MRYMLLIHTRASRWKTLTQQEKERFLAEYVAFTEKIVASGEHCHGAPLADRTQSRAVRVRDGRAEITAGPLTDSDEYLAGYHVVECSGPERALEIAAEIPDAALNVVEVRPMAAMGGLES
ncbi:YciI family protein [Saccharopolyspora sp. NPDC002578]